jgi:catechol 2,3-dioxygenase-like lactoylglutathione lyase family enzyme
MAQPTQEKMPDALRNANAVANLAVKDMKAAKKFYEDTLGFAEVDHEGQEFVVFKSGNSVFNVYRSQFAGTNRATAVTWSVGKKLDEVVRELRAKGIAFEHYDLPGAKLDGDVHVSGDMRVAWFKDPDGNILNLVNR